jgi:hypothetical protein
MRKFSITPNIAHLGINFWRKIVAENSSYCFSANNTLLLCLDDNGVVLLHFFLNYKGIPCSSSEVRARVVLAKSVGASTLVRIQKHSIDYTNPFQIKSLSTKALYETADLYHLRLAEVIFPDYCLDAA